eukprot:m.272833 g.272833  ORF g.272833 m.272833 type:complete len:190 (-) comp19750_c2_seq3:66-635(-)
MLFLSKNRILHRDIKPGNILLGAKGEIKLCDFGLSKFTGESMRCTTNTGSNYYLPPERIEPRLAPGLRYGSESDVWSLGLSIVELGETAYPYKGTKYTVLFAIVDGDPPSLPRDLYEDDLCDFVNACLIKQQQLRPQLLRPAMEDATQLALADNAFFVANKDMNTTGARRWLVDNIVAGSKDRTTAGSR